MSFNGLNHTEDWVQAFKNGEEKGFDFFFRQYFSALCFFANRILKNENDAKDIVQDCFVRLWSGHATIKKPSAIKSYLYTTVRNASLNFLRDKKGKDRREVEFHYFVEIAGENWLDQVTHAEMIREIHALIHSLPPRMQEVFRKYYIEGKNYNEIAGDLQTTPGSVRKQRARALTLLREKLGILLPALLFFI